jgi:hypothetical protein
MSGDITSAFQASSWEHSIMLTFLVDVSSAVGAAPESNVPIETGNLQILYVYGSGIAARHATLSFTVTSQLPDGSLTAAIHGEVEQKCTAGAAAPGQVYGRLHMTPAGNGWIAGSVVLVHDHWQASLEPSLPSQVLRTAADSDAASAVVHASSPRFNAIYDVSGYDIQIDLSVKPVFVASFTLQLLSSELAANHRTPVLPMLVPGLSVHGSLSDPDTSSFVIDFDWMTAASYIDLSTPEAAWGSLANTSHVLQGGLGSSLKGFYAVQAAAGGLLHVTVAGMLVDTLPLEQKLHDLQWCEGAGAPAAGQLRLQLPDGSVYHAPGISMHAMGYSTFSVLQGFHASLAEEQQPPVHASLNASSAFQALLHVDGQWWLFGADHVRTSHTPAAPGGMVGLALSNGWARNMCSGAVTPMQGALRVDDDAAAGTLYVASGLMALQAEPALPFDGQVVPSSFSHLLDADSPMLHVFEAPHTGLGYRPAHLVPNQVMALGLGTGGHLKLVHDTAQGLVAAVWSFGHFPSEFCDYSSLVDFNGKPCLAGPLNLIHPDPASALQFNITVGYHYDSWFVGAGASGTIRASGRVLDGDASMLRLDSGQIVKLSGRASVQLTSWGVQLTLLAWYTQPTDGPLFEEERKCIVAPAEQPAIGSTSSTIGSVSMSLVVWPTQLLQHMPQYTAFGLAGSVALPSSDAPLAAAAAQYASSGAGSIYLLLPVPGQKPYQLSIYFGIVAARLVANTSVAAFGNDSTLFNASGSGPGALDYSSTLILEGWARGSVYQPCNEWRDMSHVGLVRLYVSADGGITSGSELQLFDYQLVSATTAAVAASFAADNMVLGLC